MLEYARWKYVLVAFVLVVAFFFALPNFFGEDPALQVVRKDRAPMDTAAAARIAGFLDERGVHYHSTFVDSGRLMVRFADVATQLQARDAVNENLKDEYITALSFASRAPAWITKLGLRPMPLGLDLRGGLHLLYQVDVNGAVGQLLESYEQDFRRTLGEKKLPYLDVVTVTEGADMPNGVRVLLAPDADATAVRDALRALQPDLGVQTVNLASGPAVQAVLTPAQIRQRQDYAIQQNLTTLRNRVNELGVSEPIVQRQGFDRIIVQLPGVQNSADVKDILGKVATLEFRLVDTQGSIAEAVQRGRAPLGSKLYKDKNGQPVLLKRELIVTGDQLTDALTAATQDGPGVSVKLDARGGAQMLKTTQANLGKPMAVVFIEKSRETVEVDGKKVEREVTDQRVISVATIRGVFSNQFQITGLTQSEARELALLLRAGSLAAPIFLAEERAIGPSLGAQNIEQGVKALIVGMLGVFVFMALYYQAPT